MQQTLKTLFAGIDLAWFSGSLDRTVSRLTTDSRRVTPGCLFFALPGAQTDGSFFIEEAVDRGASAIVTEQDRRPHSGVTFIRVPDARMAMAQVARRFFEYPDRAVRLFGVTGSHGKTTAVHLLKHLLDSSGRAAGMTGSIRYDLGSRSVPSVRTTPESLELIGLIAEMKKVDIKEAVIEMDTVGIRHWNVYGLELGVMVFLNLSEDSARAEGSMDAARALMRRMFDGESGSVPEKAVVNIDDPWGRKLAEDISGRVPVISFGRSAEADVRATGVVADCRGTQLRLEWPEGSKDVELPMAGAYNVSHFLAAAAACYAYGRAPERFTRSLSSFPGVPGRMERIDEGQGFGVFVDYAHNEATLGRALDSLREVVDGRVLVVFGCGGDRERSHRGAVLRTVQERADYAWATADNPRGEPLERIFSDMRQGVVEPEKIAFVEDRREALRMALDSAAEGDCVVLAGKGHESFQEMGDTLLPFDDRMIARELLVMRRTGNT